MVKLDPEKLQKLNLLSNILMEMTKIQSLDPVIDTGSGMVQMYQSKDSAFYKNVYVCGDCIRMTKRPGSCGMVYGSSVDVVMADGETAVEKPVRYELVCKHIGDALGKKIDPEEVKLLIMKMARETITPPWPRKKWDRIMDGFNKCKVLYKSEKKPKPGLELDKDGKVRFVFTHQIQEVLNEQQKEEFTKTIKGVLTQDPPVVPITEKHKERIAQSFGRQSLDVNKAMSSLKGLQNLVHLEYVVLSMNNVVCVCTVSAGDIESAHAKVMAWANVIIEANNSGPVTFVVNGNG